MAGNHSENHTDLSRRVAEGLRAWLTLTERRQLRRVRMWDPGFIGIERQRDRERKGEQL